MSIKRRSRVVEISLSLSSLEVAIFGIVFLYNIDHHVQHLSSGGGVEVLPVPSGDGFEAENSINFLGQSILFHNLLSFTL
jgi:hypothetical protein